MPSRRPHLTDKGTLCDQDWPCVHARYELETRLVGALGDIATGAFVALTAAILVFALGK